MPRGVRGTMMSEESSVHHSALSPEARALAEDEALAHPDANLETIARPMRVGADSACGCPVPGGAGAEDDEDDSSGGDRRKGRDDNASEGCATNSTRLFSLSRYPPSIAPLYSRQQWDAFLASLNEILENTTVPSCPLALGGPIPPFLCLLWYCRSSRARERVESIANTIQRENDRLLRSGLRWTNASYERPVQRDCGLLRVPLLRGTIELQMDRAARTQFELDNPRANQYLARLLMERATKGHNHSRTNTAAGGTGLTTNTRVEAMALMTDSLESPQMKLLARHMTFKGVGQPFIAIGASASDASAATPTIGPSTTTTNGGESFVSLHDDDSAQQNAFVPILPEAPEHETMAE